MTNQSSIKDKSNLKSRLKIYISDYELNVILNAVYLRRMEAKMQICKIEEGIREASEYEFWKKVYNDCNQVYIKLINYINLINENLKLRV